MHQQSKHRVLAIWLMLLGFVLASGASRRAGCCCVLPDAPQLQIQCAVVEAPTSK